MRWESLKLAGRAKRLHDVFLMPLPEMNSALVILPSVVKSNHRAWLLAASPPHPECFKKKKNITSSSRTRTTAAIGAEELLTPHSFNTRQNHNLLLIFDCLSCLVSVLHYRACLCGVVIISAKGQGGVADKLVWRKTQFNLLQHWSVCDRWLFFQEEII